VVILLNELGFRVTIRSQQLFLIATIIKNTKAVLSKTIPLEYLERRGYLELRRKVRRIEELNREIKKVKTEEIDEDTRLESGCHELP